jgi:hypothetical protein
MKMHHSIFVLLGSVLAACDGASPSAEPDTALSASAVVAAPAGCGTDTIASNASGAAVMVASDNWNGSAWVLEICATTDGVHWVGPTAIGDGQKAAAAIAPNGRAVLVWADEVASTGAQSIQGSILPPGGSWSNPVTISPTPGDPSIKMDSSGNALAMWATAGTDDDSAVQTSTLTASSTTWTAPFTLVSAGGLATLVGNAAGDVLVTWRARTTNLIQGASGTILGGFGAAVTFSNTNGYVEHPSVPAINSAGDAVVAWMSTYNGTEYATRTPSGTWSSATQLAYPETAVSVVVNGAGNFVLTWTNSTGTVETLTVP